MRHGIVSLLAKRTTIVKAAMNVKQLVVPHQTLWSFVRKVGVRYDDMYGNYSDGMTYEEMMKAAMHEHVVTKDECLFPSDLMLLGVKESGVEAYDIHGFGYTIVRLWTKGGVVLKGGDDIMEFLRDLMEEVEEEAIG